MAFITRKAPIATNSTPTIRAPAQYLPTASPSRSTRNATSTSAPTPASTAPTAILAVSRATLFTLSRSSAFASAISWRTSVALSCASCRKRSPSCGSDAGPRPSPAVATVTGWVCTRSAMGRLPFGDELADDVARAHRGHERLQRVLAHDAAQVALQRVHVVVAHEARDGLQRVGRARRHPLRPGAEPLAGHALGQVVDALRHVFELLGGLVHQPVRAPLQLLQRVRQPAAGGAKPAPRPGGRTAAAAELRPVRRPRRTRAPQPRARPAPPAAARRPEPAASRPAQTAAARRAQAAAAGGAAQPAAAGRAAEA